jgi:hypothetical protein
MELSSAEYKGIQAQVKEWLDHPEHELETTFGTIDTTTFLSVAKRLRARGFTSLPQGDALNVMTKENIRFTLSGLGIIQQYCRDDVMAGKPYGAMIKDRAVAIRSVDIDEYGFRLKARREIPMANDDASVKKLLDNWAQVPKAFRMIRRWTFESDGVRVDMSIVRSTKKLPGGGAFKWQKKFRDQEVMQAPPTYEIEVELVRMEGDTEEKATKRLIRGIGEVLRGIQKNVLLIRKSTVAKVLNDYKILTGSDKFRGPAPRTLQKKNFLKDREAGEGNIRDGYNVTDKADGLRCVGFCDGKGELFLIDMSMRNVYRTGLQQPECRVSLIDGEWVTLTKDKKPINQFLAFDIFYAVDKKDVSQFPFQPPAEDQKLQSRYGQMEKWITTWNRAEGAKQIAAGITPAIRLQLSMKEFIFAAPGDERIFRAARRVLDTSRIYYTDGLIFTPNTKPLPASSGATFYDQFKWKPPKDNTVDFLIKFQKVSEASKQDKVTVGVKPGTEETVQYKTLRLFVGSSAVNPRSIVLNQQELPRMDRMARGAEIKGDYKPVLFTPKEFPDSMASYCNMPIFQDPDTGESYVRTHDSEEPILDKTIVEMSYDPKQPPGWRWNPLRVRNDKTERFQSGVLGRTLNSEKVAEDVWDSIYDPITTHMIKSGGAEPNEEEQEELMRGMDGETTKAYYDRKKAPTQDHLLTRTMRDFHNRFVKERILYRIGLNGTGKTLLDMACGVGADLGIWIRYKVGFVLGVDYSGPNITGERDGIYRRYMERLATAGKESVAPMVFAIGNSVKNYVTGEAGTTPEEQNILRSVLGRVRPTGPLPSYIEAVGASRLKTKADCMSCMFAIHYFFETRETFSGFLKNVAENLKVGGYFIGCCFDGKKIFDLLRATPTGNSKVGIEKESILWSITKEYEEDELPTGEESFGLPINVNFVTIGTDQREYLVNFETLKEGMASVGCELMSAEKLAPFKMPASSELFGPTWEMAGKAGQKFPMPEAVKQFSFLNRWFVFQRKQEVGDSQGQLSGLATMKRQVDQYMDYTHPSEMDSTPPYANYTPPQSLDKDTANTVIPTTTTPTVAATTTTGRTPTEVQRTIPVARGVASPEAQTYTVGELFQFYSAAADKDILGIGDRGAGKWLSPTAPFPIEDPMVADVKYPSLNHYLAAMKYRVASNTPDIATTVFSREGTIHQKFLLIRTNESDGGTKPIPAKRDEQLLKEEDNAIKDEIRPSAFKRYRSTFDEALWASKKDEVLKEGLRQRWETDARFRKIVEAARDKGKTLLYYAPGANSSNMGGVHRSTGIIEGENRIGKYIMELAGF